MKKIYQNFQSNLTPKASLRLSPFDSENISSLDRQLNMTNLFSNNRLGLSDSLEGGQSITLGFDYDISDLEDNTFFSSSLGQIFRDTNDKVSFRCLTRPTAFHHTLIEYDFILCVC